MNEVEQEIRKRLGMRYGKSETSQRNIEITLDRMAGTKWKDIADRHGVRIERAREIYRASILCLRATMEGF